MTSSPAGAVDRVSAALVAARAAVAAQSEEKDVQNALIALNRSAHDALFQWEADQEGAEAQASEPASWRTPLDELRLQTALAEMEVREAGSAKVHAAQHAVLAVTNRIAAARHEVGEAVAELRTELRRVRG